MRLKLLLILFLYGSSAMSLAAADFKGCLLWPRVDFDLSQMTAAEQADVRDLQKRAEKYLTQAVNAMPVLRSAGKTDKNDPTLITSRKAFQDADHAAVLALAFKLSKDRRYFNKARAILLDWARVNQPTGHPIDENRLKGMIWAYDLIAPSLSTADKTQITAWLEKIRIKKLQWQFGPQARTNNHYTHQLMMLLLLDKVLHKNTAWESDVVRAKAFSHINLDASTGKSIDYAQRNALYYHNYDLQPWIEISLMTGCCKDSVTQAFHFLVKRIHTHQLDGEFKHSNAPIDALRATHGFAYAKKGGTFNLSRAAPTITAYYTLTPVKPPQDLQALVQKAKPSPWLSFLKVRQILMKGRFVDQQEALSQQ